MQAIHKFAIASALVSLVLLPGAQQKPKSENMWINATCSEALEKKHVLVSVIFDGKIVSQKEWTLPFASGLISLPPGAYHVKMEGAGLQTQTKGPYQMIAGESTTVNFTIEPGPGAVVVHYGEGPMSREEIATRIKKLEDAVAKLQKGGR